MLRNKTWLIADMAIDEVRAMADLYDQSGPQYMQRERPAPIGQTGIMSVRDGVGIIKVRGPMFSESDWFTDFFGIANYEEIGYAFAEAVRAPQVKSIMLDIDSPGGMASGMSELSSLVRSYAKQKPIETFSRGSLASGAYWLASATNKITVTQDSISIGSIGAVMSISEEKNKPMNFVSSVSPYKRMSTDSPEFAVDTQRKIDVLGDMFVSEVANYRSKSVEHVKQNFGQGKTLVANDALKAGMVDAIATFEQTLSAMSQDKSGIVRATQKGVKMTTETSAEKSYTAQEVNEQLAAVVSKNEAAVKAAVAAERSRVMAITQRGKDYHCDAMANEAINAGASVEQFALQVMDALKNRGGLTPSAMRDDASPSVPVAAAPTDAKQEPRNYVLEAHKNKKGA